MSCRAVLLLVLLGLLVSSACSSDQVATLTPAPPTTTQTATPAPSETATPTPSATPTPPTPPTATPTPAQVPVSRVSSIRPGCKRVTEPLRPDPKAPPVPADQVEVRDGLRIVPSGAYGVLEYEECPLRTDLGEPSPDEAAVRAAPLFIDLVPYAPPGFQLVETLGDSLSYSNTFYLQRFGSADGADITVQRLRRWRWPEDFGVCTGADCIGNRFETVDLGVVKGAMVIFEESLPLYLTFAHEDILTRITADGVSAAVAVDFARRMATIVENPDPVGASLDVTEAMLAAIQPEFGPAEGFTLLVPCTEQPVRTTWCYRPEALQFGERIRVDVGRREAEGAVVFYLAESPDGGYAIAERYPPAR